MHMKVSWKWDLRIGEHRKLLYILDKKNNKFERSSQAKET